MLDNHLEELYVSLLSHYGYDLRKWLRGEDTTTPQALLAMARNLPEGSPLSARLIAETDYQIRELKKKLPAEEFERVVAERDGEMDVESLASEHRTWTLEASLLAQLVNILASEGRPIVGPSSWTQQELEEQSSSEEPNTEGESRLAAFFAKKGGD